MTENDYQAVELLTEIANDISNIKGWVTFWGIITVLVIIVVSLDYMNFF